MILAMRPDFVAQHWDEIREVIGTALPPTGLNEGMSMNNVLETILSGGAVCWTGAGADNVIQGFLITTISTDYCTGIKSLHLYALAGNFTGDVYEEAWGIFIKYAKEKGCRRISGMSKDPMMLMRAKMFNWNTEWHYLYKEV